MPPTRVVLIGQSPSSRVHASRALLGAFHRRYAPDLQLKEYARRFRRVNLVPRPARTLPASEARRRARHLRLRYGGFDAVFFGREVARHFGHDGRFFRWRSDAGFARCCVAPHPSGRSRWWNDRRHRRSATRFFDQLLRSR